MSLTMVGAAGVVALIMLILTRLPIALCFMVVAIVGLTIAKGIQAAQGVITIVPYMYASHYVFMAIPLFIVMGVFAHKAGISQDLYEAAFKWLGHVPGGLAIATVVACAGFAATSGASIACAAAMGAVSIPEMKKHGYSLELASGTVAAGGTLGILIPPSLAMIMYGGICEVSVTKMMVAGIIPGLLLSAVYCLTVYLQVKRNPSLAPSVPKVPRKERIASLKGTWMMLVLFVGLMGGIFGGVFTATEAAAVGAFGAFLFTVLRGRLNKTVALDVLDEASKSTSMIFLLIIGAMMFSNFMALTGVPLAFADWVTRLPVPPMVILASILLSYFPLGMIMDGSSMLVLTLPIYYPIVVTLGFDPIWFGILVIVCTELALITPPVGMNVFILRGVSNLPLDRIFKGAAPFFISDFITLAVLTAFPQISLFLPSLMMR